MRDNVLMSHENGGNSVPTPSKGIARKRLGLGGLPGSMTPKKTLAPKFDLKRSLAAPKAAESRRGMASAMDFMPEAAVVEEQAEQSGIDLGDKLGHLEQLRQLVALLPKGMTVDRVLAMQDELTSRQKEVGELEGRNSTLKDDIAEMERECKHLEGRVAELEEDNRGLTRQLDRATEEKVALRTKLQALEVTKAEVEAARDATRAQVHTLQVERDDLLSCIHKHEAEAKEAAEDRKRMVFHHQEEMDIVRRDHEERLRSEAERAAELEAAVSRRDALLRKVETEVDALRSTEEQLRAAEARRAEQELATIQAVRDGLQLKIDREVSARRQEVEGMQRELQASRQASFQATALALKLSMEGSHYETSIAEMWDAACAEDVPHPLFGRWLSARLVAPQGKRRRSAAPAAPEPALPAAKRRTRFSLRR